MKQYKYTIYHNIDREAINIGRTTSIWAWPSHSQVLNHPAVSCFLVWVVSWRVGGLATCSRLDYSLKRKWPGEEIIATILTSQNFPEIFVILDEKLWSILRIGNIIRRGTQQVSNLETWSLTEYNLTIPLPGKREFLLYFKCIKVVWLLMWVSWKSDVVVQITNIKWRHWLVCVHKAEWLGVKVDGKNK